MIAHVDADAFFAAVLVRKNPKLAGKPMLALGMGGGCVISASYEAKAKGVKTGMRLEDALKLAPDALQLPSDFRETGLASQQIESILETVCPLVEAMSIDEWFLDLESIAGGCPKDLERWATQTRERVLSETAISVSVGVAPTKLLAKMASEYRKPGGVTVICRDATCGVSTTSKMDIAPFLADRPAAAIPGIGRKRVVHADAEGWKTAWDIAQADPNRLITHFGRPGVELKRELLGERLFEVSIADEPPKSVSRCRSFKREGDVKILWAHLLRHTEYLILKMRRYELACRGLSMWIRDHEYKHIGCHFSLPQPTHTEEDLQPYVKKGLAKLCKTGGKYTQIGLSLWRLEPVGATQLSLFEDGIKTIKRENLQTSLDVLHERFGRNSITRGSALQIKSGTRMGLDLSVYE